MINVNYIVTGNKEYTLFYKLRKLELKIKT